MTTNEKIKTSIISHPWTMTIDKNGIRTMWYIFVEIPRNCLHKYVKVHQYKSVEERQLDEDYIISIRPSPGMPIDDKLAKLPKFVNEPYSGR